MRAGRLDRRITFEEVSEVQSSSGAPAPTWAALATDPTVWAGVRDLNGDELYAARQVNAEITTRFTLRWRSDITRKMRINYEGKLYDIHHIAELPRRRGLQILAAAQVD